MEYREHDIEWDDIKIERFWQAQHRNPALENNYFTKQVGDKVLDYILKYIDVSDNILDYGTGKGHMVEHLLKRNFGNVTCCDFSKESVNIVNEKFKERLHFNRCIQIDALPSSLESKNFDCIFLIDTIEHLIDKHIDSTLKEIVRVMKKKAHLIITTVNDEQLDLRKIICPDCGAKFHAVQHVRSFTETSLSSLLSSYGFSCVCCDPVDFRNYSMSSLFKRFVKRTFGLYKKANTEHLLYIGRKQ